MKPYSNDLRRRIVEAYENNDYSQREVAELLGVSQATVKNLVRRQRETGTTDALPPAGGPRPCLSEKTRRFVQEIVKQINDLTLEELCQRVERKYKKKVSLSTLCRLLQTLGLPRKKRLSTPRRERLPEFSEPARITIERLASSM